VTGDSADRELLFEALAVHLGYVPRRALDEVEATRRRTSASVEERPLVRALVEAAVLTAEQSTVLEGLVEDLLSRHGDVRRSLDSLAAFGRLRAELERRRAGEPFDVVGAGRGEDDPSSNPTLPSVPMNGEHPGLAPVEDEAENSFLPGMADLADDDHSPLEPRRVDWSMGSPTSLGARFRILRHHAQGGIGKVSVAFDAELQREVALKQIKPERADDDSRARFLLEAEVTGRLEHPGIVPVYGLGLDEDGRPFYAMRFVRGTSFEAAINAFHGADNDPRRDPQERSLALRHLLDRFVDVCQTVAYAHSRGVLHRDLKPANVLLGPFNESLVVDWGLAKVFVRGPGEAPNDAAAEREDDPEARPEASAAPTGRRSADGPGHRTGADAASSSAPGAQPGSSEPPLGCSSSTDTVAGTAFGTPAYMSPEQADGRLDRMGPASDVYSLGATLYTLLAGRPAFDHVWCDVTAMLDRVRLGEFPPPRRVNPRVPRALEAVCLKAMASRPEDRYASATELAREIERWMADEPVHADREPAAARLARWGRRHRPIVAGAAALLLTAVAALSAGIVLVGREQRNTEQQRLVAEGRAEVLRRRDATSRVNLAYREYLDDNVALGDELLEHCPIDLRAWEWEYARRLGHSELKSWMASEQGLDVWSVAFAPDGQRIAAGTGPWGNPDEATTGELVVREVHSGAEAFAVRGLKGAVQAVAYSPDGRTIAAAHGFTGTEPGAVVMLLDAGSGRELWRSAERGVQVLCLAFAPDGRTLAAGCGHFNEYSSGGYVRIRDARTGAGVGRSIAGPTGGVLAVAFAPDGATLAMTGRDVVDLHDLADPRRPLVRRLNGHVNFVYAVAFSPDGRRVATAGWDKTIRLWDLETGGLTETLTGHRGFVRGLAFSPDGRQLVSGSEDRSVRRWELDGGDIATFHGHTGFVHCVAFGPDGAIAASGSLDGTVKIWPAAAPDSQVTFRNSSGWVGALAFAPDGRRIASAHSGNVRIWDPRTGEEQHRIMARRETMGHIALAFSPGGETLAASGPGGEVILWDTESWARRGELAGGPAATDVAFAPGGRTLATSAPDGRVRVWDVAGRTLIRDFPGHDKGDNAVAFSPDGRSIAAAGDDRVVRIWETTTGATLAALSGHLTGVRDVAFSPDGSQLVSVAGDYRGSESDEVKVWDWSTGRVVATLRGHTSLVTAVSYFPDGRRLATASDDRTIKLWDLQSRENVLTLRGHTSGVAALAISGDGRQVASGSIDYSARIWSIEAHEGEAAFELSLRRAAVERVQALFARHLLKDDVLEEIRKDRSLSRPLREAAMEIAGRRTENASRIYEAAWLRVARPVGSPDENALALRRLRAACRVTAEDPGRLAEYRRALALAYYRVDEPARALEVIGELAQRNPGEARSPVVLAVTAMAGHRLGRDAEARRALEQLRALVESGRLSGDPDASGFLDEAEEVLNPR
jgi:WD40 repeat protein/serine/threonine protein kinase